MATRPITPWFQSDYRVTRIVTLSPLLFNEAVVTANLAARPELFMRRLACCVLLVCLLCHSEASADNFTFDGQPWNRAWQTIATDHGTIEIDNRGDTYWDSVRLMKVVGMDYQQATAEITEDGGTTRLRLRGQSSHFHFEQSLIVHPEEGRVVTRIVLTPRTGRPELPGFEVLATGFNTNPRFDSLQAGQPVTGRMMDLLPDATLQLEKYFEAGPLKTDRGETGVPWTVKQVVVSDNLMLQAIGMSMADYGLQNTSVLARPTGIDWRVGRPVAFEITTTVTSEDEPRRHAAAEARPVTKPRAWKFLVDDPPVRNGAWDCEMKPADRHAPVFTGEEEPSVLVRWRPVTPGTSAEAVLRVDDAYRGETVFNSGSLRSRETADGWREARINLEVPAGSVYDCYLQLSDSEGETVETRLGEVVRTAGVDQPLISEVPPRWKLIKSIDCTANLPDEEFYSSSGESKVVEGRAGVYRVTGGPDDWFSYRFDVPPAAKVMRIEVDYPDDASRDVGVGVNEPLDPDHPGDTWGLLRASTGYFTGLVFPVSSQIRTFETIYFPGTPWATVDVINTASTDRSAPAAVKSIRIYQLEGELPQLPGYHKEPDRVFATWSEQGAIAALSFNPDSSQRWGHTNMGFFAGHLSPIPKEHFYRHWYQVIAQHIRYLRYRGDTGYTYGAVMYNTSRYPSRFMEHHMGHQDRRYDPAALYSALFGDNGLKVYFNVELTADYRMFQGLHLTDYEVRQGHESPLAVTAEGRQRRLGGMQGSPTLNYQGDRLPQIYGDLVCELAANYGRYPGTAGVISLSGGLWAPMYFVENVPLNDSAASAFADFAGISLPGAGDDPLRFAQRWQWIQENAADQWRSFRAVLLRDIHQKVARRLRRIAPHLQYVVVQYGSGYDACIKGTSQNPLQFEVNSGFDPRLYRDIEGINYARHYWGLYRALTQAEWYSQFDEDGPLGRSNSPSSRFREYYLDREMAAAFEGHPRTSAFIMSQFDEHWGWTKSDPDRSGPYRGIIPNIQYPQAGGAETDMQFEIALAYAQNTPNDLFYMWTDQAVQMGHEPRMQAISAFLRALPVGEYQNDRTVDPPLFVRKLQDGNADVIYAVNTSRQPQELSVTVNGADVARDRVRMETINVEHGKLKAAMKPFGLRVFELMTIAPAD